MITAAGSKTVEMDFERLINLVNDVTDSAKAIGIVK